MSSRRFLASKISYPVRKCNNFVHRRMKMNKEQMIREIVEMLEEMSATDAAQVYWYLKENYET